MNNCNLYLRIVVSSFLLSSFLLEAVHGSNKRCYIVYMGAHSHGPSPTSFDMEAATNSHFDLLASVLGSNEKAKEVMIYSYNKHINGFSALLEEEEAALIAIKPNVVSVFLSKEHKLHTTRSWEFLGLRRNAKNTAWQKGRFGENTIIANIDTGVWPESKSFSDNGYGPVPSKWQGGNVCQLDKRPRSTKNPCNRKLIGARYFSKAFEATNGNIISPAMHTARDFEGHGTHTLSIAGGNFVPGAHVFAVGNGTAKGGSPSARVAAYKVCWSPTEEKSCHEGDILAAIDQAISDGVDVINLSVGGRQVVTAQDIFTDAVSLGAFHAISRSILLVASAGNDGPAPQTVVNGAPWIFTIGASTIDREFRSTITFSDGRQITGGSLSVTLPPNQAFDFILATDGKLANATIQDAQFCRPGTLNRTKVAGKIVNCLREGNIKSVAESLEANAAGALGMLLENQQKQGKTVSDEPQMVPSVNYRSRGRGPTPGYFPNSLSSHNSNPSYYDVITATTPPSPTPSLTVKLSKATTVVGTKPAPVMASYSSRGPNKIQPSILKPDVIAPGVNILASYSLGVSPSNLETDRRRFEFNVLQGTSMSASHVSGIAGLLKTRYPDWSPAAIKSAIMTTATTRDNTNRPIQDAFDRDLANSFDYGSGHVQPNLSMEPGLVYDLHLIDYLNFLCASGYDQQAISALNFNKTFVCKGSHSIDDLNYPSITLPNLGLSPVTVIRTLTNVGPSGTYNASAKVDGCKITIVPNSLTFKRMYEKKTFKVIVQASSVIQVDKYQFGEMIWTDRKHRVRSPITIRRRK